MCSLQDEGKLREHGGGTAALLGVRGLRLGVAGAFGNSAVAVSPPCLPLACLEPSDRGINRPDN